MPLNARNCRTFHRTLYAGILIPVTVLKRGNNQKQGTVTAYQMYQVRQSMQTKTGETIQEDSLSNHRCSFHFPIIEMERVGIQYFNPADIIIDKKKRYWNPESTTLITVKLFEDHVCLDCLRIDPTPQPYK